MTIDFHSHILCGVDHGSRRPETTKAQLELMGSHKTALALATPHFYPDQVSLEDFLLSVERSIETVKGLELRAAPELAIGAEVLLCSGLDRMEGLERLCVRGTRCILLELPTAGGFWQKNAETVENIISQGYTVVLAHIDRYLKEHEQRIDELLGMGAVAQVNADSLCSLFTRGNLLSYIDGGYVSALGSDLHGAAEKDYKKFSSLKKKIGEERFDAVMSKTERLLEGAQRIKLV